MNKTMISREGDGALAREEGASDTRNTSHIHHVQQTQTRERIQDMTFVPGLTVCREFFEQIVQPIMEKDFPEVRYSAGLMGSGSEVLGFDTARSTDHDWRPRVFIFLSHEDNERWGTTIEQTISHKIPTTFKGFNTSPGPNAQDPRNRIVHSLNAYFSDYLNVDVQTDLQPKDWLTIPEQRLLSATKGDVFFDGLGELQSLRERFNYYPHDVWLYLLASQWQRISQEEPFVGRTGDVGDELGSQILAAKLVKEIMKLCFLMERQYAPYSKWFGTAFCRLPCAKKFDPIFQKILHAETWKEREKFLGEAHAIAAEMHNTLAITKPMHTNVSDFHDRPYQVIHGEQFAAAISEGIEDDVLKNLPAIGSVDQFVDSTDVLENPPLARKLRSVYE